MMTFFDSIQERSKKLFYASCSDMARLDLTYDDGNQYKVIILNMKALRAKLNLPACPLDREEDFKNYVIAIEKANLNAVHLFTELGCDPFSKSSVFHDRLFKKENSFIALLEKLKRRLSILDPSSKEHNRFKNMVEWLDQQITSVMTSQQCTPLMSSL